jgi:predicted nucleic acid-binding protein
VVVLDASVLIAHLDQRDAHHERATQLLPDSGTEPLEASTISLAETLAAPARAGRLADANDALERLGIDELPLGDGAAARLAQLRADTGRKLPDCCLLLTAETHDGVVATFDSALVETADGLGLSTRD